MEDFVGIKNKNDETIYTIIHLPNKKYSDKTDAVILLHGWLGCKTGPHRLFVKIARSLTSSGYLSLRFDFRGRGSSQSLSKTTIPTLLDDAKTVINFVIHKKKINQINLIGLSLGSIIALLLKNGNLYPLGEKTPFGKTKLERADRTVWGGTNAPPKVSNGFYQRISKIILLSPLPYTEEIKKYSFKPSYKFNIDRDDILLVFGKKDPIKDKAIASYKHILGDNIKKNICEIENAEHGFYSLLAEDLLIQNILRFITGEK